MKNRLLFFYFIILILISVIFQYKKYTFLHGDGTFYANINRSLTNDLSFRQEKYTPMSWYFKDLGWNQNLPQSFSNISLGKKGELYPKHPVILPVFSEIFFLAFGYNGLLLFNILLILSSYLLLFKIFEKYYDADITQLTVFLLFISPTITILAYSYSNDFFYMFTVFLSLFLFQRNRFILSGVFSALSLWAKITNVIPLFFGFVLVMINEKRLNEDKKSLKEFKKEVLRLLIGFLPVIGAYLFLNYLRFGSPFITSYDRIIIRENGLLGMESAQAAFDSSLFSGIWELLTEKNDGLIVSFPAFVLSFLGVIFNVRRFKHNLLNFFPLILFLVLFGVYRYKYSRFFLPYLLFAVEPIIFSFIDSEKVFVFFKKHKKKLLLLGMTAASLTFAVGLFFNHILSNQRNTLSSYINRAKVFLNDTIPCDFFNLKHQKWECSHFDFTENDMVGLSVNEECDGKKGMIFLPFQKRVGVKKIVFLPPPKTRIIKFEYFTLNCNNPVMEIYYDKKMVKKIMIKKNGVTFRWNFNMPENKPVSVKFYADNSCTLCFDGRIAK